MKMNKAIILSTVLVVCGCGSRSEGEAACRRIRDELSDLMPIVGGKANAKGRLSDLLGEIGALPDYASRLACVRLWVDHMLAYDMSALDSYWRGRNLRAVRDIILSDVRLALGDAPTGMEDAWDIYLQLLAWLKAQMQWTLTTGRPPSGMDGNCVTNAAQARAFMDWTNSYNICVDTYASTLRRLQNQQLNVFRQEGLSARQRDVLLLKLKAALESHGPDKAKPEMELR